MLNTEVDHLMSSALIRLLPLNVLYSCGHGHANVPLLLDLTVQNLTWLPLRKQNSPSGFNMGGAPTTSYHTV